MFIYLLHYFASHPGTIYFTLQYDGIIYSSHLDKGRTTSLADDV